MSVYDGIEEVKVRFRLEVKVVLAVEIFSIAKRFDGDDSFAIPILYIEEGFCKVKKRVKMLSYGLVSLVVSKINKANVKRYALFFFYYSNCAYI